MRHSVILKTPLPEGTFPHIYILIPTERERPHRALRISLTIALSPQTNILEKGKVYYTKDSALIFIHFDSCYGGRDKLAHCFKSMHCLEEEFAAPILGTEPRGKFNVTLSACSHLFPRFPTIPHPLSIVLLPLPSSYRSPQPLLWDVTVSNRSFIAQAK